VFKIPDNDIELKEILTEDTVEVLAREYSRIRRTLNGRTISDISQVFVRLEDWETIERVDLIIPYRFAHKRNEPVGHRIWYLSHYQRGSQFYNGVFFDLKVAITSHRCIRKECRLSREAIKLFKIYPKIRENQRIEDD